MYPTTYHPSAPTALVASVITVDSGEEKSGIDLQLRPRTTVRVSGRVVGPEGPMAGIGVRLAVADPAVARTSPATLLDELQAMTNRAGEFTFLGVVPGDYTLRSWLSFTTGDGRAGGMTRRMLWAFQSITIGESGVADFVVTLRSGVTMSGQIVFDGGKDTSGCMNDVSMSPTAVPGSVAAFFGRYGVSTSPDPAGAGLQFSITPLVPGPYVITFTGVPSRCVVKSVMVGGIDMLDHPVDLSESGLSNIVATVTDRMSTISGMTRDADGRPAERATVGIFPTDKTLWRRVGLSSRRTATAAPGRDGRYRLTGLPPGQYFLVATEGEPPDLSNHATLAKLTALATRIQLGEGEARLQDLRAVEIK
jgi:hypothetical protein